MNVYCFMVGDSIECGCNLISIHVSFQGAELTAKKWIAEREATFQDEKDAQDRLYVEDTESCVGKIVGYWKDSEYDIVMITEEPVLEIE